MIAVEELPLPFIVIGRQGHIQRANGNALGLLGVEEKLLMGMPLTAFLHADTVPKFMSHLWTAFQRPGESFSLPAVMLGGDRRGFSATLHSLVPLDTPTAPSPICRVLVVPEQPSLEVLPAGPTLFERLPFGLAQVDSDGRLLFCNPSLCALLDYHEDQLRGCELSRLFLQGSSQDVAERSRRGQPSRALAIRRDGIRLSVELQWIALPQVPGKLSGRLLVVRDLSQQEILERRSLRLAELERQAIGRELHDALGQNMVALALMADELALLEEEDADSLSSLSRRIAELCRETTKISRALMKGLAPVGLAGGDLASALQDLVRSCSQTFPIDCEAICHPISMDEEVAEQLFRIAQEAVTNAVKHSGCRAIEVGLRTHHEDLILTVRDDGRGLDAEAQQEFGTGLHSMHHRSQLLGAILSIEPDRLRGPKRGCRITVRLPLSRARVLPSILAEERSNLGRPDKNSRTADRNHSRQARSWNHPGTGFLT